LGKTIGKWIEHPLVIGLSGDLGSGKTAFVQGLAAGLEVPGEYYITSPTFTLINEYPGRFPLFHIDLYRLDGISDLEDIGLDELLYDQAVIAIEWAEKMSPDLPAEHLTITFEIADDDHRRISLIAYGHHLVNLIKALECSRDRVGP
jgi:tRNA threonylcarbamoyladenosine biosynthesis protein TsaE